MLGNTELYHQVQPYLHPGEDILWIGKPASSEMPKTAIFPMVFSIFFIGFSIFWMLTAASMSGIFALFGLPFLLAGLGLLYGTTLGRKNAMKSAVYAVTETRAIIVVSLPRTGTNCKEYVLSNLPSVNLENVKGQIGTIRFEDPTVYHYDYGRYNRRRTSTYSPERELTTAFLMIDNVHYVYHLISERLGR